MSLLSCRGLRRAPWLSGVDLDLEPGEIVVLRGPSGSGKTLLLRALADLDPCDAGTVLLDGSNRDGLSPSDFRRRVVYVHPHGVCLPGTVADNLERVARLAAQTTVREGHAGSTWMSPSRQTREPPPPRLSRLSDSAQLSSGEAQALALQRALAGAPDVLLLDEATSALDGEAARAWERLLVSWVKPQRALLWAAHDDALAERLGAREFRLPGAAAGADGAPQAEASGTGANRPRGGESES